MPTETASVRLQKWIHRHSVEVSLFLIGCFLRILWLKASSLWYDETLTLVISRARIADMLPLLRKIDTTPPLHYFIIHFGFSLFSDPFIVMRSFSAFCAIASLALFAILCRRIVPENPIPAFFMGCFSSYWVHIAQDGRCYSLYLLIALLEIGVVFALRESWSKRLWLVYTILGCLGAYTHYYFIILLLTHFSYLCLHSILKKRSWKPLLAAHLLILLFYIPWIPSLLAQGRVRNWKSALPSFFGLGHLGDIFGLMTMDLSQFSLLVPNWVRGVGFLAVALLIGSFLLIARGEHFSVSAFRKSAPLQTVFFLLFHLTVPLCGAKAAELITGLPLVQSRYFLFMSPFIYWTFALALKHLPRIWEDLARIAMEAAFVMGICGYYAANHYNVKLPKVAASIRAGSAPETPIVYLNVFYYPPMRYYYMPERSHFLVTASSTEILSLNSFPGYNGIASKAIIEKMSRCVVFDPTLKYSDRALWIVAGKELSALLSKDFPSLQ